MGLCGELKQTPFWKTAKTFVPSLAIPFFNQRPLTHSTKSEGCLTHVPDRRPPPLSYIPLEASVRWLSSSVWSHSFSHSHVVKNKLNPVRLFSAIVLVETMYLAALVRWFMFLVFSISQNLE